jgi:hypothetical protein
MDGFRLHLFPDGSLDASVITTVWVGVWVVAFLNLRLGWTFSGLVVPGYMVPLLLVKPWAGFALVIEGVVTYFLVWLASEYLSERGFWSSLFGRDRYFGLLLMSLPVRVFFDGWLWPVLGDRLNDWFPVEVDSQNNLQGFGLILIPLIANQFWKPGLVRGLWPMAVTVGITYVLVRWGLMEFTNFSLGNLQYMYQQIAWDLLASPKAYVLTITAAFLASRMNLLYSWEYHGIHIPALLALQWYEPLRILCTVVEALTVFLLAKAVLRLPGFRGRSFEGASKVVLFFNVAFLYKLALGYLLLWYWPAVKVTDYYAIGYLLSALMAVKAHDKEIPARLMRVSLQVSIVGALVGSLIGFALTLMPAPWRTQPAPAALDTAPPVRGRLTDLLRKRKISLYQKRVPESVALPSAQERQDFARGIRLLQEHVRTKSPESLRQAREHLARANYRVDRVQRRYLFLSEKPPERGWGMYALDARRAEGVVVEVPAPLDEWAVLDAGALLFERLHGQALAVAGGGRRTNRLGSADVLVNPRTIFHTFHTLVGRGNVLQVRGYTQTALRALFGIRRRGGGPGGPEPESTLWVNTALPPGLNLAELRRLAGPYQVHWDAAPPANVQRETTPAGFAELFLNRPDRRKLLASSCLDGRSPGPPGRLQNREGYLLRWLADQKNLVAESGTNQYQPAHQEELLFLDEEVLTPALKILRRVPASGEMTAKRRQELDAVAAAAALLGFELLWFRDKPTGQECLILAEPPADAGRRSWGTYVLRPGRERPFAVQVPRPLFERNSFEYGLTLFDRLQASCLFLAGAHPFANADGTSDPVNPRNKLNLVTLAGQIALREAGDRPLLLIQARAFGVQPNGTLPDADALLALSEGNTSPRSLSPLAKTLWAVLEADRLNVRFVDGGPQVACYEASGLLQTTYLDQTRNKEFALLWLSPLARTSYRQQAESRLQDSHFQALNIKTVEADLWEHLRALPTRRPPEPLPARWRQRVEQYLARQDFLALYDFVARGKGYRFERVLDLHTQQAFLLIYTSPSRLPLVVNLAPLPGGLAAAVTGPPLDRSTFRRFLDSRAAWLRWRAAP